MRHAGTPPISAHAHASRGKILFNNKRSVIDCMVRNISASGACVLVANVVGIPATFDLVIDGESASRPCAMVWHANNRLGIEFRS